MSRALSIKSQVVTGSPARWRSACRIGATFAVVGLLAIWLVPDSAYWALLTVFILASSDVGSTWRKGAERVGATFATFAIVVGIVGMFPQSPAMLLIVFAMAFMFLLYLSQVQEVSPYAAYLGCVTLVIIMAPVWEDPSAVVPRGLARCIEISIGVVGTALIAKLLWPTSAERKLSGDLCERLVRADHRLRRVSGVLAGEPADLERDSEPVAALSAQLSMLRAALAESAAVRREKGSWLGRIMAVNRFATQSQMLEAQIAEIDWREIPEQAQAAIGRGVGIAQSAWRTIGEDLLAGRAPAVQVDVCEAAAAAIEQSRPVGMHANRAAAVTTVLLMLRQLKSVAENVAWQRAHADAPLLGSFAQPIRARARFRIDRLVLKTTIKAAISTVIALLLIATFRWTGAAVTAAVTTLLVTQPTIGASWNKAIQRVVGVLIGAVYGLVVLVVISANTNDIFWLLAAGAIGAFAAGWLMAGTWETSYVGLQIGIAISLVLGAGMPSASLDAPIGRVFGILVGALIALFVLRLLWPVWARQRVCDSLATAALTLSDMLEAGIRSPEAEAMARPRNGWSFKFGVSLSEAFRFREEARYECGLSPARSAPALRLATLLQDALPRMSLIIQARYERSLDGDLVMHEDVTKLRKAVERRIRAVADIVQGGDPVIEPLPTVLERAVAVMEAGTQDMEASGRQSHLEVMGYYQELCRALDDMVPAAKEAADQFLRAPGMPDLSRRRRSEGV